MSEERERTSSVELDPEIARRLHGLAADGEPPRRDLWPTIRQQIVSPPSSDAAVTGDAVPAARRSRASRWLLLAAAVVPVVIGLLVWSSLQAPKEALDLTTQLRSLEDLPDGTPVELRALFVDYLGERQRLLDRLAAAVASYPPELQVEIRNNIAVIETAMHEIESSLTRLPDPSADELQLASLYERELRFLRGVEARLRGSAWNRE